MGMKFRSGGLLTTIQDAGRCGYQQFGVPVSGAMDLRALALGNILVGNPEDEAALEVTLMGPQIEFTAANVVALTGADLTATLNGKPMQRYRAVTVKAGDVLSFGAQKAGSRAYLAVAGGFEIEPVMGSRSTYLKAQMGGLEGRKLGKDDFIGFRAPKITLPNMGLRTLTPQDYSASEHLLRVIIGPQDNAFTKEGLETFLRETYSVTTQSDRMGCRLDGTVIKHKKDGNIISDGISLGAVQVPSEGKPIIMLADRQTTGGYTKIANVITVDLPKITQSSPGDTVRFEEITVQEAQKLYLAEREEYKALRERFCEKRGDPNAPVEKTLALAALALWEGKNPFTVTLDGHEYRCTVYEKK